MVRILSILIILCAWDMPCVVYACDADSTRLWAYLTEGDQFYNQLDNRRAIDAYRKAHREDSSSYPVLVRLARTLNEFGKDLEVEERRKEAKFVYEEANHLTDELLRLFPDSARTYLYLAAVKRNYALFEGGRQKLEVGREVEMHCRKGLSLDSTDADLHIAFAVFNREATDLGWVERTVAQALFGPLPDGSKELSKRHLMRAIALDPTSNLAHFELALTYLAMGERDEAIAMLENVKTLRIRTTRDRRNRELAMRMLERLGGVNVQ